MLRLYTMPRPISTGRASWLACGCWMA